jgi:hypothetical protein
MFIEVLVGVAGGRRMQFGDGDKKLVGLQEHRVEAETTQVRSRRIGLGR